MADPQDSSNAGASQFDFWLGDWHLSWPAEQTQGESGKQAQGSNQILKILDGRVIQENFSFKAGHYQGKSWSVYNARLAKWQQTWVDSSGAYLLFEGKFKDGKMELRSKELRREDKVIINRMVFRDITESSFFWDWQHSNDGGLSWQNQWNISYQRKPQS